jgi:hypothetical protein
MTGTTTTLRALALGALLTGTFLVAGCGGRPERVTSTTTTEQTTSAPPPVSTTTTTTTSSEQIRQEH